MLTKAVLTMLAAFVTLGTLAQQKTPVASPASRFQIVSVVVDEPDSATGKMLPAHEVFLLDSQTGKIWRYQPDSLVKDPHGKVLDATGEQLIPVAVLPDNVPHPLH